MGRSGRLSSQLLGQHDRAGWRVQVVCHAQLGHIQRLDGLPIKQRLSFVAWYMKAQAAFVAPGHFMHGAGKSHIFHLPSHFTGNSKELQAIPA
jgi:hypothetical protein